jgi:hypothetical protein
MLYRDGGWEKSDLALGDGKRECLEGFTSESAARCFASDNLQVRHCPTMIADSQIALQTLKEI